MEHVQSKAAACVPVVHRLEGDQGEPPVDRELGNLLIMYAVRPAPQDMSVAQLLEVLGQGFGEQDDIAARHQFLPRQQPGDVRSQLLIRDAETPAVAAFEVDELLKIGFDPLKVQRVDRQPVLVLLA